MNPISVLCYYTSTTVNLPEVRLTPASLSLRSFSQKTSRLVDPASTQHMQNSIQDSATQHSHGDTTVKGNIFSHARVQSHCLRDPVAYNWVLHQKNV